MNVFTTQKALVGKGRALAHSVDTVTFDLFDTLLVRRIHDPDLVKLPVARYIAARAAAFGLSYSPEYVQERRDSIEQALRRETGQRFKDHEACYPVFMGRLLEELFREHASGALLQDVTAYEMDMESSMLVPRGCLVAWLRELYEQGKTILIVSDVYLPASLLRGLVERAGFLDHVTDIVSSADTYLAKASGEAFRMLVRKYDLNTDSWLHVGDNPISDGLRPEEFGITALVLNDHAEKRRKSIIKRQLNYSRGRPFWRGRVLQQLMLPLEEENRERDALYVEGYNFIAPLIGVFVQEIAERCRRKKITKIFFLSREGHTFMRFWEQAVPLLYPEGNLPEIEYLYVSRMALAGASCAYQGLTRDNADIVFLPAGNKDFRDICRVFSLDGKRLESYLAAHKLDMETVLSPVHDGYVPENTSNFHALLENVSFQEEIKRQTRPANDALQLYLKDKGFFDHADVALVDIGWLGTIPRFLYEAVAQNDAHPVCHTFLFGATRGIEYPTTARNFVQGLVYDKDRFDFAASAICYSKDFFEEACRAPHPTLNGYELSDDGYKLVFRRTDDEIGRAELEQDDFFSSLQQGVFDAASRFGAASALLGYPSKEYKAWINYLLVCKMAFPTTREVLSIRHRHHLDDFQGSHKPGAAALKGARTPLWDAPLRALRWNPFLRLKHYLLHLRTRLNE